MTPQSQRNFPPPRRRVPWCFLKRRRAHACNAHALWRSHRQSYPFEGAVNASPLEETMELRPRPFVSAVAFNRISTFSRENAGRWSATTGAKAASTRSLLFFSSYNGFCLVVEATYEIQSKLGCSILSMAGAGWMVRTQSTRAAAAASLNSQSNIYTRDVRKKEQTCVRAFCLYVGWTYVRWATVCSLMWAQRAGQSNNFSVEIQSFWTYTCSLPVQSSNIGNL